MNHDFKSIFTPGASVENSEDGFRLKIPGGDKRSYRVAQLDDYAHLSRRHFPAQPPQTLSLHARASKASLPGTWGFGLWNDPFGLSIGFGGNPLRFPTLPNAIWFFHASDENFLSFGDGPGNGFLAQVFRSPAPRFPFTPLLRAGINYPLSRRKARTAMSEIVEEKGFCLNLDVTQWHEYRFEWRPSGCVFWVDDALVLETSLSPRPPLGLVIWIDNQFAAWHPDEGIQSGVLETKECWLEVEHLELKTS
jgi:hypothetical protein